MISLYLTGTSDRIGRRWRAGHQAQIIMMVITGWGRRDEDTVRATGNDPGC